MLRTYFPTTLSAATGSPLPYGIRLAVSKSKYGGMEVNEAQRPKGLKEENRRLKQLVADLSLDKEALKATEETALTVGLNWLAYRLLALSAGSACGMLTRCLSTPN
jgi:hypothetical protein